MDFSSFFDQYFGIIVLGILFLLAFFGRLLYRKWQGRNGYASGKVVLSTGHPKTEKKRGVVPRISPKSKKQFVVWESQVGSLALPTISPDAALSAWCDMIGDFVHSRITKAELITRMDAVYRKQNPERFFRVSNDPAELLWLLQQVSRDRKWIREAFECELGHVRQIKQFELEHKIGVPYHFGFYCFGQPGDGYALTSLNTPSKVAIGQSLFNNWDDKTVRAYFRSMKDSRTGVSSVADVQMLSSI